MITDDVKMWLEQESDPQGNRPVLPLLMFLPHIFGVDYDQLFLNKCTEETKKILVENEK